MVVIDEGQSSQEFAYSTGLSGASLTLASGDRGLEGTSAAGHSSAASVKGVFTAKMWNDMLSVLNNWFDKTTGSVKPNLGSDATGDIYYRGSDGLLKRLGIGSDTQSLVVSSGLPSWGSTSTDGWLSAGETWTYASADSPTFTFTISGDKTTKYYAGMRIKLTQTTDKYFIITAVSYGAPNTTVTVYGGTDYTLANAAITSPYYSMMKAPAGFPLDPTKWTVSLDIPNYSAAVTNSTWTNLNSKSISIPIGLWNINYKIYIAGYKASTNVANAFVTLSTANNSESDVKFTSYVSSQGASTSGTTYSCDGNMVLTNVFLSLAAKTTYYVNFQTTAGTGYSIAYGTTGRDFVKAICAYL